MPSVMFAIGENKRVDQSKIFGRQPRPRSKVMGPKQPLTSNEAALVESAHRIAAGGLWDRQEKCYGRH
eukprot:749282-Hanusia_phi.AAC.2